MTYTYDEALASSTAYFAGDEMAAKNFLGKYALKTLDGELLEETPDDMHLRLAKEFARIEAKYPNPLSEKEIFDYLRFFKKIVPQGSPMAGIGNPFQIMSISNCFVIQSPYDSYGGILKTDQEEAQIMKRRGGVGTDISTIRPRGLKTANAAQTTDGIGVFMERFSNTCREVAQGGRRGALMLTISVHHPEIRTFVHIKEDLKKVTGANISIRLTDEFMEAVKAGKEVQLRFPVEPKLDEKLLIEEWVDAAKLWDEIITAAHTSAEPGLLFWDTIMKYCPANSYPQYKTISTNPCGEITLSAYDSCRLLLINTLSFVKDGFTEQASFDWKDFAQTVRVAQRLMDDVVDLELECIDKILAKIYADPEPEDVKRIEIDLWNKIREACVNGRRTGLGVTAVGDMVAAMGMRYGNEDSIRFVEHVYRVLCVNSYACSIELAKERGSFPAFNFELEKGNAFLERLWLAEPGLHQEYLKYGRRNIANLTTAPAGTVSTQTQTTSGIENVPYIIYTRRKKRNQNDLNFRCDFVDELGDEWQEFKVHHHGFQKWKEVTGLTDVDVERSPYWGSTINDVDWVAKVKMQAAAQKWIDHSISNTTNLPKTATIDDVKAVYMAGWESGCKGVTIYRDGSRSGVLVADVSEENDDVIFEEHHAPKRPHELGCDVYHNVVQGEKWVIFVGLLGGKPYEVMGGLAKHIKLPKRVKTGKVVKHNGEVNPARYDFHYDYENPEDETIVEDIGNIFENKVHTAFTRTLSLALRHGTPVQYVCEQLQKGSDKDSDMFSFSRVISRVLKNYIKDGTKTSQKKCVDCGSSDLVYQQGCAVCLSCGSSKCG
jgi:ribonucleoside-diphosphate reductase alpha chain